MRYADPPRRARIVDAYVDEKGKDMPFIVQAIIHPATGRGDSVRPLLEELVQRLQASGRRANLAMSLFGGARNFYVNGPWPIWLKRTLTSRAQSHHSIRLGWLGWHLSLEAKASFQLGELVVTMPSGSGQTPSFNYQATLYPKSRSQDVGSANSRLSSRDATGCWLSGTPRSAGRRRGGSAGSLPVTSSTAWRRSNSSAKSQDDADRLRIDSSRPCL